MYDLVTDHLVLLCCSILCMVVTHLSGKYLRENCKFVEEEWFKTLEITEKNGIFRVLSSVFIRTPVIIGMIFSSHFVFNNDLALKYITFFEVGIDMSEFPTQFYDICINGLAKRHKLVLFHHILTYPAFIELVYSYNIACFQNLTLCLVATGPIHLIILCFVKKYYFYKDKCVYKRSKYIVIQVMNILILFVYPRIWLYPFYCLQYWNEYGYVLMVDNNMLFFSFLIKNFVLFVFNFWIIFYYGSRIYYLCVPKEKAQPISKKKHS